MAKLVSKVYGDALFEAARDCGKWMRYSRKYRVSE